MKIFVRAEVFKEGDVYVAFSPDLNISSFGETVEDAKKSIKEAIEVFLEECRNMGTLEEVLEEAGFLRADNFWQKRELIAEESLALVV